MPKPVELASFPLSIILVRFLYARYLVWILTAASVYLRRLTNYLVQESRSSESTKTTTVRCRSVVSQFVHLLVASKVFLNQTSGFILLIVDAVSSRLACCDLIGLAIGHRSISSRAYDPIVDKHQMWLWLQQFTGSLAFQISSICTLYA